MSFIFNKAIVWLIIALIAGAVIGWFLNGWRRKAMTTTDVSTSSASSEELERLRGRVANLEPVVADRDTLRKRVAVLEAELKDCRSTAAAPVPAQAFAGVAQSDHDSILADRDRLRGLLGEHESSLAAAQARIAGLEGDLSSAAATAVAAVAAPAPGVAQADHDVVVADRDRLQRLIGEHEAERGRMQGLIGDLEGRAAAPVNRFAHVTYNLDEASSILGGRIKLDDLKVVEGIGPKIEELCHAGGITTWAGLADTPVSRLQEILDAAGERYRIHNPATWPRQSELLALGEWARFKQLTDELTAGRE